MNTRFAVYAGFAIFCSGFLDCLTQSAAAECGPAVGVEPMTSGLARLALSAPCFPRQKVHFSYGELELVRQLDEAGRLTIVFDCFLGEKTPLTVSFAGGFSLPVELRTLDLDRVTIIAVIWKGGVNLDLHAFEYAAKLSDDNHVWAGSPGSPWQAEERKKRDGRGHGFRPIVPRAPPVVTNTSAGFASLYGNALCGPKFTVNPVMQSADPAACVMLMRYS